MSDSVVSRTIVPPCRVAAAIALRGPGRLGVEGPTGVMIFDAGKGCGTGDMVARFFGEEIDGLHWLEDYLVDRDMLNIFARLEDAETGADDDEEVVYDRKALVNIESDAGWSDVS
ncbi:MAG: hypothetical protein WDN04_23800 [Rhodospirillales bacterium]